MPKQEALEHRPCSVGVFQRSTVVVPGRHKRVEVLIIDFEAFRAVPGRRELVEAVLVARVVAEEFAPIRGRAVRCALLHRVGAREAGVTGAAFAAVVHKLKGVRLWRRCRW